MGEKIKGYAMPSSDEKEDIEKVDMDFREMFTNLFDTSFLTPDELDSICDCAEMYAAAKVKNAS